MDSWMDGAFLIINLHIKNSYSTEVAWKMYRHQVLVININVTQTSIRYKEVNSSVLGQWVIRIRIYTCDMTGELTAHKRYQQQQSLLQHLTQGKSHKSTAGYCLYIRELLQNQILWKAKCAY